MWSLSGYIAHQHARTRIFILALYFLMRASDTEGTRSTVLFVAGLAFILLFFITNED